MITVQLYGKNIANARIKSDVPVAPITTSDNIFLPDGTTLTSKLIELEKLERELEIIKKKLNKTSKE